MRSSAESKSLQEFALSKLLARRAALINQREAADASARELLGTPEADWEDRAANVTAARSLTQVGENERAQLALVQTALGRLDDGSWGVCVGCGKAIGEARLRAAPEALRCARCT